jgi:hypothetical protein
MISIRTVKKKIEDIDRNYGLAIRGLALFALIAVGIIFLIVSCVWMIVVIIQLAFAGSWIAIATLLITGAWIIYKVA